MVKTSENLSETREWGIVSAMLIAVVRTPIFLQTSEKAPEIVYYPDF